MVHITFVDKEDSVVTFCCITTDMLFEEIFEEEASKYFDENYNFDEVTGELTSVEFETQDAINIYWNLSKQGVITASTYQSCIDRIDRVKIR